MIPVPIIIGGIVILILALAGTAGAASLPGGRGAEAGPGSGGVKARFGPLADRIPAPMPAPALLECIRHESGGKPGVVVADQVVGASELGACQLVVEHDANGNPDLGSHSGAIGADVDPLDPLGAVYGAQWVYAKAKQLFAGDLEELGFAVPGDDEVPIWSILMQFQHSMGRTAFKRLMEGAKVAGKAHPLAALQYWATDKMPPKIGRQSSLLIRKRVKTLLRFPATAETFGPLPARIGALPERPADVPRFDAAKAKRYILAERRRGSKPRQADGSPPGV